MTVAAERRPGLLPWAVGSAGIGALSTESPMLAAGIGVAGALALLPAMFLFAVLAVAVGIQDVSWKVAGFTFRPDMLVVAVFAFRAFTLKDRATMKRTEWALIAFMLVQVVASLLHAANVADSLRSAALIGFGALACLSVSAVLSERRRLLLGGRIWLFVTASSAVVGIGSLALHYLLGTWFGVTGLDTLGGFPAATGIAYEHDVFGSTCAAAAIAFLVLWRERNPLVGPAAAALGFWVCSAGTLLSLARGAWVGFAVGLLAAWLVSHRVSRSVMGLVTAGAAVLAVGAAALGVLSSNSITSAGAPTVTAVSSQASRVLDLGSSTGAYRLMKWKTALREVETSPWLGLGTNSYGQRHFDMTQFGPKPAFVGNWFVRTLYDSGLIGLALFLAFAVPVTWPGAGLRRARGDLAPVARALALACIVIAVAYLATDALLLAWPWVLLGITGAARRLSVAEERASVAA